MRSILEAVKVLLPRLYSPVATKCRAGVAATIEVGSFVTNVAKELYTAMVVVSADVRAPMANKGRNTGGKPAIAGGGACGTMSGVTVAGAVRSMLSEPMRITAAFKLVLARLTVSPASVAVANGAVVPLGQSTSI